jgi:hypothetical protein
VSSSDDVGELKVQLARIEGKLDGFTAGLKTASDRVDDHESRLRRVERIVYLSVGAAIAVGGASGAVASALTGG